MYTLYSYPPSGNCYKAHLAMHLLDISHRVVKVDILQGKSRTAEFLEKNPVGQVPLLQTPEGAEIAESHAILRYLGEGSHLIPKDRLQYARMWQWLCFEQYQLEPSIAVLRFRLGYLNQTPGEMGDLYDQLLEKGKRSLTILNEALEGDDFILGDSPSLADIGLYGYTHVADEVVGPLEADYPNIVRWCKHMTKLPGYVSIIE